MAVFRSAYTADYNASFNPNPDPPGHVDPAYGVAEVSEDNGGWLTRFGWATPFTRNRLPDAMRMGTEKTLSQPQDPNQRESYARMDANEAERESVVCLSATLRTMPSASSGKAQKDNPYYNDGHGWPEPDRMTMRKSPASWMMTRPYDQDSNGSRVGARRLNGDHFSMADHRRNYEIMGMEPVHRSRNTYRLDPVPWDEELVDGPTNSPGYSQPINYETTTTGTRSYRLS